MRGGSLDHHMRWIVVVSAALATRGAAQNRTEAPVACAGRLAGASRALNGWRERSSEARRQLSLFSGVARSWLHRHVLHACVVISADLGWSRSRFAEISRR